jgi:hypothetical protein
MGRAYGSVEKDYSYGCLIDILIPTVPTPLMSFSYSIAEAQKENGKKNTTRDVKTSKF